MLPVHPSVQHKLDVFFETQKIPHIIFHGASGTGKRTIVHNFINRIYGSNKELMRLNVMVVNCAHGKGIKFIREDLKFFAKSNIQNNNGKLFKTIVLINADFLTMDAQSALRRCIELFSNNTRFFITVENKNKLLNPILSRFCIIHIPEQILPTTQKTVNLHEYTIAKKYVFDEYVNRRKHEFAGFMNWPNDRCTHAEMIRLSDTMYENGYSALDLEEWIKSTQDPDTVARCVVYFRQRMAEYRCEKLLILCMLNFLFGQTPDVVVANPKVPSAKLVPSAK
jgi:hypothetical protein